MPDPDAERYVRLCRLLDGVIAQPQHSRYLVLPELALPAHWFIRIARLLVFAHLFAGGKVVLAQLSHLGEQLLFLGRVELLE